MSNSSPIIQILQNKIKASPQQQITFAEYMNTVLYHPQYGYYSSESIKIGNQGDFFTSSSLGSDFGELLAVQFLEMWKILDYPSKFSLIEMGAGTGLLASDILNFIKNNYSDFYQNLNYIIIETSSRLIEQQKEKLAEHESKIFWKTWEEIDNNSIIGCFFSNELVDAFPVYQVIIESGKLKEIYITLSEPENFQEKIDDLSTSELEKYFKLIDINILSENYPDGYRTEVNLEALQWLESINHKLKQGYLLTIDYGYTSQKYYHPQRYQGTLKCYYQHRHHNNPYINIGSQDITAHVDFTALERQGELCGLEKLGFTKQGLFLMALGLGDRLSSLSSGEYDFQTILSRRDALHQLLDPTGLGGFGVLLQTKGLTEKQKERSLTGLKQD
jgi:SAM-dependent MidA family methyltransferase